MSSGGTLTIRVQHARNSTNIAVSSTGAVGATNVNTVHEVIVVPGRIDATSGPAYWNAVLAKIGVLT
jgi:hypothetical protein